MRTNASSMASASKRTPPTRPLQAKPSITRRSLGRDDKAQYRTIYRLQKIYGFKLAYDKEHRSLAFRMDTNTGATCVQEDVASCLYLANLAHLKHVKFDFFAKIAKAVADPRDAVADLSDTSGPASAVDTLVMAAIIENYAQLRLWSFALNLSSRDVMPFNTAACLPELENKS